MTPEIECRPFAKPPEGGWIELEDFRRRHPAVADPRTWTSFCAWFPGTGGADLTGKFRPQPSIELVASVKPHGTWLLGGHWWLELALREISAAAR